MTPSSLLASSPPSRKTSLRGKKALLLGMVYSTEMRPLRGQEFRDRVRCEALDARGYVVHTMDDKHTAEGAVRGRHCTANFSDTPRMMKALRAAWGETSFDLIVLDYFFSPNGWASVRWSEQFFKRTISTFAEEGILADGASLWLPHVPHVDEMLQKFGSRISEFYDWNLVNEPERNPLFAATENVTKELIRTPDFMTNETQLKPLSATPGGPFYELRRKTSRPLSFLLMSPSNKVVVPSKRGRGRPSKKDIIFKVGYRKHAEKKLRIQPRRESVRVLYDPSF